MPHVAAAVAAIEEAGLTPFSYKGASLSLLRGSNTEKELIHDANSAQLVIILIDDSDVQQGAHLDHWAPLEVPALQARGIKCYCVVTGEAGLAALGDVGKSTVVVRVESADQLKVEVRKLLERELSGAK